MKNLAIDKLIDFNIQTPILEYYAGFFDGCYVVLHPFHKRVFHEDYDYKKNYEYTFPLIETVKWAEVMKGSGIRSLQKLAIAICSTSESDAKSKGAWEEWQRLEEYLKVFRIEEHSYMNDIIPCEIILVFLRFLLNCGFTKIITSQFFIGDRKNIHEIAISKDSLYKDAVRFEHQGFIASPDFTYCLQLPYFDSPHSLLLTNGIDIKTAVAQMKLEGFYADDHTTNMW